MAVRVAILGLDPVQRPWLEALAALRASGEVELAAVGHRSAAACRDAGEVLRQSGVPVLPQYDDPRLLVKETSPEVLVMDRPPNASLDFLCGCLEQNIALLALGPPVESLGEAQVLAESLEDRSHLLQIWPRFADAPACRRCAQADDFLRPIRFASAAWLGTNHALAKAGAPGSEHDLPVRSLTVLAWDALATLIALVGVPTSAYAAFRGTIPSGNSFADISGSAAVTLRFADDAAAAVTLCDRAPPGTADAPAVMSRRELFLWGNGTLRLSETAYEFRDDAGRLIDGSQHASLINRHTLVTALRGFLEQIALPPSPHRARTHHLVEIAATLEALLVSHRTGQPESPDRFLQLRR